MSSRDVFSGPQNEGFPGLIEPGNILNLYNRPQTAPAPGIDPGVGEGSRSTTLSKSFNLDGQEVLVPTIVNGKFLSDEQAIRRYRTTGQHLGKFADPASADKYATSLHGSQQAVGDRFGGTTADRPIRVRLKSGHVVEFPKGTSIYEAADHARQFNEGLGGSDPQISPRTWTDEARNIKGKWHDFASNLIGLPQEVQDDLKRRGISLAMIPIGPPSESGQMLLNTRAPGVDKMPQIVDPEMFRYRPGQGFNSLIGDSEGHLIDLPSDHETFLAAMDPQNWDYKNSSRLADALERNKFARITYFPKSVATELHHKPSEKLIDSLTDLYMTAEKMHPGTTGSFDLNDGSRGSLFKGVPSDLFDKLFQFYWK